MRIPFTDIPEKDDRKFNEKALDIFKYQASNIEVFKEWLKYCGVDANQIDHWKKIPFLPISLFKRHAICESDKEIQTIFRSSGTQGVVVSRRLVTDISLYETSFTYFFEKIWGKPSKFKILALLPGYLERDDSSLVYMFHHLMQKSLPGSGFFLNNYEMLIEELLRSKYEKTPTLLLGVTHALVDFCGTYAKHDLGFPELWVMETGGMKGKAKEPIRKEIHKLIASSLNIRRVCSEYGMTELYSQGYCKNGSSFMFPPWVRLQIMNASDFFQETEKGRVGIVRVVDLANQDACSFIETQDLGREADNQEWEILGRLDFSETRGCSLMAL